MIPRCVAQSKNLPDRRRHPPAHPVVPDRTSGLRGAWTRDSIPDLQKPEGRAAADQHLEACAHLRVTGQTTQVRLEGAARLPDRQGSDCVIETGVHTMWSEQASTNGYQWAGARIISISGPSAASLDKWLDTAAH
jgi:hypothetical protein